jgi:hypothetical protein
MKGFFLAILWVKAYQYQHKFFKNKLIAQAIIKMSETDKLLNRESDMTAPNVMGSFKDARGRLAMGLVTLALLTPGFAQSADAQNVPPLQGTQKTASGVPASYTPSVLRQAGIESAKKDALVIGILRGQKDSVSLERIISGVSQILDREDIPYHVIGQEGQGNHTYIMGAVRGHFVGEYNLGNIIQEGIPDMVEEFKIWTSDGPLQQSKNETSIMSPMAAMN